MGGKRSFPIMGSLVLQEYVRFHLTSPYDSVRYMLLCICV